MPSTLSSAPSDAEVGAPPSRRARLIAALIAVVVVAVVAVVTVVVVSGNDDSPSGSGPHEVPAANSAMVGKVAPDFAIEGLDGGTVRLSDYRGKPVVLNFWASWCTPCRQEVPLLQKTHEQIAGRGGVVLGVDTQDVTSDALSFLKERKATFPSLRDRDRSYVHEFGVTGYPETFLIDRQGRVAALRRFPVTRQWLDQHLTPLLAESS